MSAALPFRVVPDEGPAPVEADNAIEVFPSPKDPMPVARAILEEKTAEGEYLVRHWRGDWMRWTGSHWTVMEEGGLQAELYARLEHARYAGAPDKDGNPGQDRPWSPNRSKVADVMAAMAALVHLDRTTEAPCWLDTGEPAGRFIACQNGLLDIVKGELLPPTPRYFGTVGVPFNYDPRAPQPVAWLDFLHTIWPMVDGQEPEEILALQEWFGYVLSGRTDLQKILMLVGPTRSGKGTITRTLEALLGRGNYCSPTLAGLATNFGLWPLIDSSLATIADARLGRDNVNVVVERLLSISGEDTLTVDRKNREAWSGRIPARLVLCSNELPRFGDASGAITNRFILLTMERSFLGQEDNTLSERIQEELPGILRWALEGLGRVNRRRRIHMPSASAAAFQALTDLVSPTAAFLREACDIDARFRVVKADLFEEWRAWCDLNGNQPGSQAKFTANLRAAVPRLADGRANAKAPREYVGLTFSAEWHDENGLDDFRGGRIARNRQPRNLGRDG